MSTIAKNITELLTAAQDGDREAADELFTLVYQELRQMAQHYLRQERPNHTLQATALVNELYLRLFNGQKIEIHNRAHFFGIVATQMRRILVDHARRRQARRRDASEYQTALRDPAEISALTAEEIVGLHEALTRFSQHYPLAGQIVELRYFGGYTETEAAEILGISLSTLKREWSFAKCWLKRALDSGEPANERGHTSSTPRPAAHP